MGVGGGGRGGGEGGGAIEDVAFAVWLLGILA